MVGIRHEHALSGIVTLKDSEVHLLAVPYFFSALKLADASLQFKWTQNGQPIAEGGAGKIFGINGESGSSDIGVEVSKSGKIFQTANSAFKLNYGAVN